MYIKVTTVLALMFFLFGCEKEERNFSFDVGMENEFLADQEYFSTEEILKFTIEEINDSRCPKGVYCIWQGEARVHLLFEKPVVNTIELSTFNKLKDTISNYEVQLIDVVPFPEIDKEIELENYKVKLKFSRL